MTRADELTDLGNARRFATEHADRLRFIGGWNAWAAHMSTHWRRDEIGRPQELAKLTATEFYRASAEDLADVQRGFDLAMQAGDNELAMLWRQRMADPKKRHAWAIDSMKRSRLEAMVALARSSPEFAVHYSELDADPWLFNVRNGTVDLRTGKLHSHRREDLITKLAPVDFDAAAICPAWNAFLARSQNGDEAMLAFIQRAVGYCLTGVIHDHVLLFLYGPAGTGKSTFFRVVHALLGDYAVRAPRSLLFQSRGGGDRHPTELSTLHGARFVSCNEIDEGATFDEALVKDLTGGEEISARRMREDFWTFKPTHKLAIGGNYKPRVRNFDDAIRRRVRLIPWTVKPSQVDTSLFDKLVAELPGILAWAVRGCLEWQRIGLAEPAIVRDATDAYQSESDPLREFFDLHCVFDSAARTPRAHVRVLYEEYCRENGAKPLDARPFAAGLRARGVTDGDAKHNGKTVNGWRGVRLATDAERERRYQQGTGLPIIGSKGNQSYRTSNSESGTGHLPTTGGFGEAAQ